ASLRTDPVRFDRCVGPYDYDRTSTAQFSHDLVTEIVANGETCVPPDLPALGLEHRSKLQCQRSICFGVADKHICHGRPRPPRSTLTNFESGSPLPLNELLGPMSDIFISYSKADHALALKLSAFLEAEGWSVWWDKSLGAADLYRDEIMKQLAAARTVIT